MKSLREKEKEKGISLIFIQVVQGTRTIATKRIKNLKWEAAELTLHERPIGIPTFLKTIN